MKKLLNILYITNPDIYLSKDGENVIAKLNNIIALRVPVHTLEGIVYFGYASITPQLLEFLCERNVHISYISPYGNRFIAKIQSPISGNVRLRRAQYKVADDVYQSINYSVNFVIGKLYNSRCVLQRLLRDHPNISSFKEVNASINELAKIIDKCRRVKDLKTLRGYEGQGARKYYGVFGSLITDKNLGFCFRGRSRRPPLDEVNALLSFLYTLLAHDVKAALETVGLDPQVGFMHLERPGRASLALDIMEELRPYIVDRATINMINNKQVSISDFLIKENGSVLINTEARKKVLEYWQNKKKQEVKHPYIKEKVNIGLIPFIQSQLLARSIRGDMEEYPPFLMR